MLMLAEAEKVLPDVLEKLDLSTQYGSCERLVLVLALALALALVLVLVLILVLVLVLVLGQGGAGIRISSLSSRAKRCVPPPK